jgi:xylan 1,4-beta-xylosidase
MHKLLLLPFCLGLLQAQITITVDASAVKEPMDIGRYALGQGGLSDEPMFDRQAELIRSLKPKIIRLFVQEYFDVYPSRGVYNWKTLDRSVENILSTGAKPLMSICIKPKALYPEVDQDKVHPTDYAEWEELIYQMVRHYKVEKKAGIQYWEVFNEPDIGEDGGCPSRFKAADYAKYYEHTVRAIRRADPTAKVGGPALASHRSPLLKGLLDHCSKNNIPLDFVSWHIYNSNPQSVRNTITAVKDLLRQYPSLHCETILDEWNVALIDPPANPAFQPAYVIETIYQMRDAGLDWCAYYHIRDYHASQAQFTPFMTRPGMLNMVHWWNLQPQNSGLFDFQGTMRPAFFAFKLLSRLAGNRLETKVDSEDVHSLSAYDPDQKMTQVLVWNFGVKEPPARNVRVAIRNLNGKKWFFRRTMLDAVAANNDENARLHPVRTQNLENITELEEGFELPPYGVALLSLRQTR